MLSTGREARLNSPGAVPYMTIKVSSLESFLTRDQLMVMVDSVDVALTTSGTWGIIPSLPSKVKNGSYIWTAQAVTSMACSYAYLLLEFWLSLMTMTPQAGWQYMCTLLLTPEVILKLKSSIFTSDIELITAPLDKLLHCMVAVTGMAHLMLAVSPSWYSSLFPVIPKTVSLRTKVV